MKKLLLSILFIIALSSCNKDKFNNDNPYLGNYGFSIDVNLSYPLYNDLNFAGNSVKVDQSGAGNRGIIVFNNGSGFKAYDGACPNQSLTSCSTLMLNGMNATCSCDNAVYNLYTGQSAGKEYPLKEYRVEINGNILRIYN